MNLDYKAMFEGFQNTPLLWQTNESILGLKQFSPNHCKAVFIPELNHKKLRLGKWVESFISFQLSNQPNIKVLFENLQIKKNKQTIGELDAFFIKERQPIHLEIIYKFYLFDTTKNHTTELDHWVGPNRNDALVYKLDKLINKQLPLLCRKETSEALKDYFLDINSVEQLVCFKAQLFLPYIEKTIDVKPLNRKCVVGFYLTFKKIKLLKNEQFYIPTKLEWLIIPNNSVSWLDFDDAFIVIKNQIKEKRSPLLWVKDSNNKIQKCFITWW